MFFLMPFGGLFLIQVASGHAETFWTTPDDFLASNKSETCIEHSRFNPECPEPPWKLGVVHMKWKKSSFGQNVAFKKHAYNYYNENTTDDTDVGAYPSTVGAALPCLENVIDR